MAIKPRTGILLGVAVVAVLAIVGTIIFNVTRNNTASEASGSTVTWWVPDWDSEVGEDIVAQFEEDNPDIDVEIVTTTGDTVANRTKVALDSGNVPDVITESIARVPTYAAAGQLADLSDLFDDDIPEDDFAPGLIDSLTIDGAVYAMPYRWATNALIYNPELFDAAGIDGPPTTWAEFEEDARILTEGDVVGTAWPLMGEPSDTTLRFVDFAISDGATIDDGTPSFTTESIEGATDLIGRSVAEGWASPSSFELDNTGMREVFLQGRIGMYLGGVFDVDTAVEQGSPVASALLPGPDGPGTAQGVGWSHILPQESDNQEAAKSFISFLAQPENMAALTLTFPARISASDDPKFGTPEREAYAEQLAEYSVPAVNDPRWTASVQSVKDAISEVALGRSTVPDATTSIEQIVEAAFAE